MVAELAIAALPVAGAGGVRIFAPAVLARQPESTLAVACAADRGVNTESVDIALHVESTVRVASA